MQEENFSILNRAAGIEFSEDEAFWTDLLERTLRTELVNYYPLKQLLAEGRWRHSSNPMGYVRGALRRLGTRPLWFSECLGRSRRELGCVSEFQSESDTRSYQEFTDHLHHKNMQRYAGQQAPERARLRAAAPVESLLQFGMIDWEGVLNECGVDDELREYILDRLYGVRTTPHTEAVRKRFQRAASEIRRAIANHTYSAREPKKISILRIAA